MVILASKPGTANSADLNTINPVLAGKVDNLVKTLRRQGAFEGAKRLELVSKEFKKLTLEEAYHIIAPDITHGEVEELYTHKLGFLHVIRNALSLCPLILTWTALCLAAISYQQILANPKYRDVDQYRPFLRLWQEGFHGATWLTFSNAALGDVILLSLVLLFVVVIIPISESASRRRASKIALELEDLTDGLMWVIGIEGINPITSEADVDKVIQRIKQTVETSLLASKQASDQAKQFIADSEVRVTNVIGDFHKDLATFNADLLKLSSDLQSYGRTIQDLSNASTQLASSSTSLATNARDMATSATTSVQASQSMAQASQGIGTQLSALNNTQQQMVNEISASQKYVANEIATTQKQVVKGITDAADIMDTVAKDTRLVAKELGHITQADLQSMTNQVAQVANQVNNVATSLSQIDQQLQRTTQVLHQAAQALASASGVTVRKRRFLFF